MAQLRCRAHGTHPENDKKDQQELGLCWQCGGPMILVGVEKKHG